MITEVERFNILMDFFNASTEDCRITKGHLALYATLYLYWSKHEYPIPLRVFGQQMMPLAKISSNATYHRLLKQLDEYGYIRYSPSYYKGRASEVKFIYPNQNG